MQNHSEKPSRLKVWGDSLLNKLPGLSRKRRKRHASKIRRQHRRADIEQRLSEG